MGLVPEMLNEDLFFNLDRATLLMRRHVLDVIAFHKVSPEQWEILQLIDSESGVSQRELTQLTLKDKGNVSRILGRMINNGWVQRVPRNGGRGFQISLTTEGRAMRRQLPDLVDTQVRKLLGPLPKAERSELLYALKKLRILLGDEDVLSS